ncbi:MAG: hypothetical protein PHN42_00265 [Bacilli bacterium]|nr:hypothetical protein [Bacilli bacterium]
MRWIDILNSSCYQVDDDIIEAIYTLAELTNTDTDDVIEKYNIDMCCEANIETLIKDKKTLYQMYKDIEKLKNKGGI